MMAWLRKSGVVWGVLFALAACQSEPPPPKGVKIGKPYVIDGKTYIPSHNPDYDKTGEGSWYGPGFHGKRTANGERFNQDDLTAAHPTLPMPSLVRVTNLKNNKTAVVRINDRGPFKKSRIIDLSKGSAERIGLHSTMPVRVQYLRAETEAYLAALEAGDVTDMFAYNESLERGEDMLLAKYKGSAPSTPSAPTMSENEFAQAPTTDDTSVQVVQVASLDTPRASTASSEVQNVAPLSSVDSKDLRAPARSANPIVSEVWADDNVSLPTPPTDKGNQVSDTIVVEKDDIVADVVMEHGASSSKTAQVTSEEKYIMPLPTQHTPKTSTQVAKQQVPAKQPTVVTKQSAALLAPAAGKASGLIVQAGSYSSEANARALAKKLGKASVDKIDVKGKSWWRVHAGPFTNQAEAEKALAAAKDAGVIGARIMQKH
jgi:rare lipoprotein A